MQRKEMLQQLQELLDNAELQDFRSFLAGQSDKLFDGAVSSSFRLELNELIFRLSNFLDKYDDALLDAVLLNQSFRKAWLRIPFFSNQEDAYTLTLLKARLRDAMYSIERWIKLLKPQVEYDASQQRVFTVFVLDDKGDLDARRLASAVVCIEELYKIVFELQQLTQDVEPETRYTSLALCACDSGRDKSFDFLGHRATVDALLKALHQAARHLDYWKVHKKKARVEMLEGSLDLLQQITQLNTEGALDHEAAQRYRVTWNRKLDEFFSLGMMTENMVEPVEWSVTRRLLLPKDLGFLPAPQPEVSRKAVVKEEAKPQELVAEELPSIPGPMPMDLNDLPPIDAESIDVGEVEDIAFEGIEVESGPNGVAAES